MEKAVIYCRVSTEEVAQADALQGQIAECERVVAEKGWLLVERYIDEGRSGTTTKRREAYNRLVQDLEMNRFDIVVVKSQDRLMRNTKEWYVFLEKLLQNRKRLFFYLEQRFYTPEDALLTGIKAILAEEFSRDLSKKINNAHRSRQQNGGRVLLTSNTWGYDKRNKEIVVNEKEAETVRLIFDLCLEGCGSRTICRELERRGIRGRRGNAFSDTTVRKIIRNPLFMGTAVMNKVHYDFNEKRNIHNPPEEWIYHPNAVPPIVSEEVWRRANAEIDKRFAENGGRRYGRKKGASAFSGKLLCGLCGAVYWRRFRKNAAGEKIVYWSCSRYVREGRSHAVEMNISRGCSNCHIKEETLYYALDLAGEVENDNTAAEVAAAIFQQILDEEREDDKQHWEEEKRQAAEKRERLLDKMLEGIISEEMFTKKNRALLEQEEIAAARIAAWETSEGISADTQERIYALRERSLAIAQKELRRERALQEIEWIRIEPAGVCISFLSGRAVVFTMAELNRRW